MSIFPKVKKPKVKNFRSFFEEHNGRFSMMRLMSFIILWVAIFVIVFQIVRGYFYFNKILTMTKIESLKDIDNVHILFSNFVNVELILILLIAAFVPKALQKFVEIKDPRNLFPAAHFDSPTSEKKDEPKQSEVPTITEPLNQSPTDTDPVI